MKELANKLSSILEKAPCWTEARFHRRQSQSVQIQKGQIKQAKSSVTSGVGIRCLIDGVWGFSSTSDLSSSAIERAVKRAVECGRSLSQVKKSAIKSLPPAKLARGEFILEGYDDLKKMPLEEKMGHVLKAEAHIRKGSSLIQSSSCGYNEQFEDKIIVTTDGANAISRLCRNEIRLSAIATAEGEMSEGQHTVGRTGAWNCLFTERSLDQMGEEAVKLAVDLLKAPRIPGGVATLILSPAMVGLLSHEAIGHTVEADFVLSGSVAQGKLGHQVASPIVSLCDAGYVQGQPFAGGALLVDDEGVPTQNTMVITNGILTSYLHNRESAAALGVPPTGNARAWLYQDEPLIRMRNTFILPGKQTLQEIIESTEEGYLVDCPLGGQADATGEFMFGAQKVMKIEKGKITKLFRGATISGQAFTVLSSVDAVSKEFFLDLGAGYCGKGQPAKVDAGGPYIRCKATIGGVQE